jgi:hypothetical protein
MKIFREKHNGIPRCSLLPRPDIDPQPHMTLHETQWRFIAHTTRDTKFRQMVQLKTIWGLRPSGYGTVSLGKACPKFRDNVVVWSTRVKTSRSYYFFLGISTLEDETTPSSRNVVHQLPKDKAYHPRITEYSRTPLRKPKISQKQFTTS